MAMAVKAMEGMTFGCDPEVFVVNDNEEFVYPEWIPGTKEEPHKVEHGAVQIDGMAAEFNIDPVDNYKDWERNIKAVMKQLEGFLPKGCKIVVTPKAEFTEENWNKAPDEAKILGCVPDFDAWTGGLNSPPDGESIPRTRTAGGHAHFGWTEGATPDDLQHLANCRDLIKQLDWYVGAWSVEKDPDPTRRRMYGRAGAMRYKDYGVEYRTPSNFWVENPDLRKEFWNRMNTAVNNMKNSFIPGGHALKYGFNDLLVASINQSFIADALVQKYTFPIRTIARR